MYVREKGNNVVKYLESDFKFYEDRDNLLCRIILIVYLIL